MADRYTQLREELLHARLEARIVLWRGLADAALQGHHSIVDSIRKALEIYDAHDD